MDDEDFVEASDSEELEILRAERDASRLSPPLQPSSSPSRSETPRKRRKVYHFGDLDVVAESEIASAGFYDSNNEVAASSTPVMTSMELPTSSTFSLQDIPSQSVYLRKDGISKGVASDDLESSSDSGSEMLYQKEPNIPVAIDDILRNSFENGSRDELDIISQPLDTGSLDALSAEAVGLQSPIQANPLVLEDSSRQGLTQSPTHVSMDQARSPSLSQKSPTRLAPFLARHSSLPPSSPSRSSSLVHHSPSRTRSASPILSQPQGLRDSGHSEVPRVPEDSELMQIQDEIDNSRRYSLRNRQPWQVNPYVYDKQRYKMQMRNNPDAIVKIVSPRRDHAHHARDGPKRPEDDEFIAPEETEETQDAGYRRRNRLDSHNSSDGSKTDGISGINSILPELSDLSDDELSPLRLDGQSKPSNPTKPTEKRPRHHKFPLEEARFRTNFNIFDKEKARENQVAESGISYTKRKITRRPQNSSTVTDRGTDGAAEAPDDDSSYRDIGANANSIGNVVDWNAVLEFDGSLMNSPGVDYRRVDVRNPSLSRSFSRDNQTQRRPSKSPGLQQDNESSDDSHTSLSEEETPDLKLRSKQMKILGHMMPKVMLAKLLGKQPPKPAAKKARARSGSTMLSGHSSEDDEARMVVPGQSRLIKRFSPHQEMRKVMGDSESSDPDILFTPQNGDPDPDSDSDNASMSGESDLDNLANLPALSELDENSGYFDSDFGRHQQILSRRKEDLIDRMLSRSGTKGGGLGKKVVKQRRGRNKPRLDVTISSHRRHAGQTRLPFTATANVPDDDPEIMILDTSPQNPSLDKHSAIQLEPHENERPKKMSKKQKRDALLRKNLFTVPGHGNRVGTGKKKGLLHVQIDMADDGFRDALAPINRIRPSPVEHNYVNDRIPSRIYRKTDQPALRAHDLDCLKQASLHDFPTFEQPEADTVFVQAPTGDRGSLNVNRQSAEDEFRQRFAFCSMDMDINPLPLGLTFPQSTYIGKQQLHDLVALILGKLKPSAPQPYSGFGLVELNEDMTASQFSEALEVACNLLREWLDEAPHSDHDNDNDFRRQGHFMQILCLYYTWIFSRSSDEDRSRMQTSALSCVRQLKEKALAVMDSHSIATALNHRILSIMWFAVEMTSRLLTPAHQPSRISDLEEWKCSLLDLMQMLVSYGPGRTLESVQKEEVMEGQSVALRTAEIWVCLLHVLRAFKGGESRNSSEAAGFGSFIFQIVEKDRQRLKADVEASEHLWRLIFTLNALSQFSVHGNSSMKVHLEADWELVALALDTIRLTHDQDKDKHRPYESLKKRDKYVRIVVARCYLLATRWQWSLQDAHTMFKKLVVIFKSRMFGNLIGEEADFPAFLRYLDLSLLHTIRGSDSTFSLFLKLVVLAAKAGVSSEESGQRTQQRLAKLLSLAVPLSGVSFSKDHPPVGDELSMLYNRYSSIIVAIYVDPSEANVQNRLDRARRYLTFKEGDERSRRACIRALMYTAILLQHLSFPLVEPIKWLEEIADTIICEFRTANSNLLSRTIDPQQARKLNQEKNSASLSIQLLLGSVRKILETPYMRGEGDRSHLAYPEPSLMCGAWIKNVFSLKELTNIATTRHEILLLAQAFLRARAKVISPPPRPRVPVGESNESQDLYDEFGFDDDVLAALDLADGDATVSVSKEQDQKVSEVMNSDVVPAIFRLVLQFFNDPTAASRNEEQLENYWLNADEWIKCWVGCAAVVVRNGKRKWDHYLYVGSQSWGGISDPSFRRRVGLHFMYHLLQCDPTAYPDHTMDFLRVLLECFMSPRIGLENDYLSLLLSVDGLIHPMLHGLPVYREDVHKDFLFTRSDFTQKRMEIFEAMMRNLELNLEKASSGSNKDLNFISQSFLECVVGMVSAMQNTWNTLSSEEDRDAYKDLCSRVFDILRNRPRICNSPRLSSLMAWGSNLRDRF